jgi:DNA-binding transcriptional LysR family regulator
VTRLDLLRSFLAVYRAGSMRQAANELGLSQAAVSAHIKALEDVAGRPLFRRQAKGVVATAAGEDLARDAAPHLDALEQVVTGTAGSSPAAGTVYLGGPAEFLTAKVLPELAVALANRIRLRVRLGHASALLAGIAAGELELAVATVRTPLSGVEFEALFEEDFVLVGSAHRYARLAQSGLARDVAALAGEPLVAYGADLPILRRYWRSVFGSRLQRDAAVVVDDLRTVLAVVKAGGGISALPRYLCSEALADGTLVVLHEPPEPPTNMLYLSWRTGALSSPAVAAVHEQIRRIVVGPVGVAG